MLELRVLKPPQTKCGWVQVSRTELDKTRNMKSLTNHLLDRVSRIKKELEEILDDDQGMFRTRFIYLNVPVHP